MRSALRLGLSSVRSLAAATNSPYSASLLLRKLTTDKDCTFPPSPHLAGLDSINKSTAHPESFDWIPPPNRKHVDHSEDEIDDDIDVNVDVDDVYVDPPLPSSSSSSSPSPSPSPFPSSSSWGEWITPTPNSSTSSNNSNNSNNNNNNNNEISHHPPGYIPTLHHTLLSLGEIHSALSSLHATSITSVDVSARFNSANTHMVFCTGSTSSHLRSFADALVVALKARRLDQCGIVGAKFGAEGYDCEDWIIVDCGNFIVQIMDEQTRETLKLEDRWKTPVGDEDVEDLLGEEFFKGKKKKVLKHPETGGLLYDDETIDRYCELNPIPDTYDVGRDADYMDKMVKKYIGKAGKKKKTKFKKSGKVRSRDTAVVRMR